MAIPLKKANDRAVVWHLVKGLWEINYGYICLFVSTIHSPIQVVNDAMHTLDQPGFAKPLTVETMLTFSKYSI